ncbi:hypothetical protein JCM5350_007081 [Sporobolomyces pararoseus]
MPTPRTRQHSVSSPWPQLSILTVYSSTPLVDSSSKKLSDEELEAAKILYFYSSTTGTSGEEMTPERRRRLLGTVMGVADFAKTMTKNGKDNKIRSVKSSKRRMVWFEPENGFFIHATISVPRHSNSKRHGREASTATTSSSRSFPSDGPSVPLDDQLLINSLKLAYQTYRLQNGSISRRLEREGKEETMTSLNEFWNEWATKWDLSNEITLEQAVQQVVAGLPMSPLLTPPTLDQLTPLLTQLSASSPSVSPFLLHASHILHIPSDPPNFLATSSSTLESFVHLILALHTARLLSLLPSVPDNINSQSLEPSDSTLSSSSNWTSSALSYLDPRNVPLPSFPSTAASVTSSFLLNPFNTTATSTNPTDLRNDFKELRTQSRRQQHSRTDSNASVASSFVRGGDTLRSKKEARKEVSESLDGGGKKPEGEEKESSGSGWGLRSVSKSFSRLGAAFTGGSSHNGSGSSTPTVSTEVQPPNLSTSSVQQQNHESETTSTSNLSKTDSALPNEVLDSSIPPVVAEGSQTPQTPAVELAPEVNEEDLQEAMKALEISTESTTVKGGSSQEQVPSDQEGSGSLTENAVEPDQVLTLFGGEEDQVFEVRLVERGVLTLALVTPSTEATSTPPIDLELLKSRAGRLLEAVETILEAMTPPTSVSTQPRYAVKAEGRLFSRLTTSIGSKYGSDSETSDLETTCALLEAHRSLNSSPQILESLIRLPTSSNWLSLTRSFHVFSSSTSTPIDPSRSSTEAEDSEKAIEVLAVLPAKNSRGRETTLVEAAEGARRIERKWVAQRCGP